MSRQFIVAISLAAFVVFNGCSSVPQQSVLMDKLELNDVSVAELKVRTNEFAILFAAKVERSADEIVKLANDKSIRNNAIMWKLYSVPAVYKTVFASDPLAGLIDTWSLCIQMRKYFQSEKGRNLFGQFQHIAYETAFELEGEINSIAKDIAFKKVKGFMSSDFGEEKKFVDDWSDDNPIEDIFFTRRSTMELIAEVYGDKEYDLFNSVGSITQTTEDMKEMLNIYMANLPNQTRGQAELLINDLDLDKRIDLLMKNFAEMNSTMEKLIEFTNGTDALVEKSFSMIDAQRKETIEIMLAKMNEFKEIIDVERTKIMAEISKERTAATQDVNKITDEALDRASVISEETIDYFFVRLIQFSIVAGFVVLLIAIFFRKINSKAIAG